MLLDRYSQMFLGYFSSVFCVDICGCTSGALFSKCVGPKSQMKLCMDKRGVSVNLCMEAWGSVDCFLV